MEVPHKAPVDPSSFGPLALAFSLMGFFMMALFFIYEAKAGASRSLVKEVPLALLSSVFLGCGTLFVMLWAGLYV
eukprot:CAMPEP_0118855016 /NCGR_PEP_ID=MMETSP1163-20130328/2997_1 /TAXON_ID=124430 /ORGANISM="Phaeomonas parva, Strain CCMP2877" /LENGTH=74 /DNA_ID=CAMNT_0006787825 /DNA_START=81 /DNA_END=305 /DNA_ORIENTATION=-